MGVDCQNCGGSDFFPSPRWFGGLTLPWRNGKSPNFWGKKRCPPIRSEYQQTWDIQPYNSREKWPRSQRLSCSFPGLHQLPRHRFQDWTMAITSHHRDTISTPRTVRRSLRLQVQFDQNMSKYCLQPTFNIHRCKDWPMVTTPDRIFTPRWSPRFVYHCLKKSAFCIIGHKRSICRQDWKSWLQGCYLLICLVWWKHYPNW